MCQRPAQGTGEEARRARGGGRSRVTPSSQKQPRPWLTRSRERVSLKRGCGVSPEHTGHPVPTLRPLTARGSVRDAFPRSERAPSASASLRLLPCTRPQRFEGLPSHRLQAAFQTPHVPQSFSCLSWAKTYNTTEQPRGEREGSTGIDLGKEKLPEIRSAQKGRGLKKISRFLMTSKNLNL